MINTQLFKAAEQTVDLLKKHKLKIATAESCTGGMVAAFITSVSGVSEVFEMGVTSYSCRIKNEILNVESKTLEKFGAISESTAKQMAENIRKISGANIGVSVTGAAGPDGSEGHNPGFVFIALSYKDKTIVKQLNIEPKSRNFVREQTVLQLFELVINFLKEESK